MPTERTEAAPLPPEAWLVAIAALPAMGPRRLDSVLRAVQDPAEAWRRIAAGTLAAEPQVCEAIGGDAARVLGGWRAAAQRLDPVALWERHRRHADGVARRSGSRYPRRLRDDPEPPAVVSWHGDLGALDGPSVAIVGTRRCTRYGVEVAFELGRDLSSAGISIVSGLALGIDAAAHAGALEAGAALPVGVVATGLDIDYPRRNGPLRRRVAETGVVLGEAPIGAAPQPWRFPARNRLVAALADAVVVVESHGQGGSLYTAAEAERRDRPVLAVPGSIRSAASRGALDLIADGCAPVREVDDVLVALDLAGSRRTPADPGPRPSASPSQRSVLEALGSEPATLDALALRTGLALGELAATVRSLQERGLLREEGGWYEAASVPGLDGR